MVKPSERRRFRNVASRLRKQDRRAGRGFGRRGQRESVRLVKSATELEPAFGRAAGDVDVVSTVGRSDVSQPSRLRDRG